MIIFFSDREKVIALVECASHASPVDPMAQVEFYELLGDAIGVALGYCMLGFGCWSLCGYLRCCEPPLRTLVSLTDLLQYNTNNFRFLLCMAHS